MEIVAVLVEVDRGGGQSAQVVLDADGDVRLIDSVFTENSILLENHQPHTWGMDHDQALVAGRLPPGAVTVEVVGLDARRVRAVTGRESWLAVLEADVRELRNVPVLFRGPNGDPVVVGLPADWPREPVIDTTVRCPACRECAWDVVTAAWEGFGPRRSTRWGHSSPSRPGRAVVCRVCGHEERMGSISRSGGGELPAHCVESPEVQERRRQESVEAQRLSRQMLLRAVTFPIYGLEGQRGRLSGSSSHGDDVGSVRVTFASDRPSAAGRLDVQTAGRHQPPARSKEQIARDALTDALFATEHDHKPDRSDGALILSMRVGRRSCRARAETALGDHQMILVGGQPVRFLVVQVDDLWAAAADIDGATVTMTGTNPTSARLSAIANPEAELA